MFEIKKEELEYLKSKDPLMKTLIEISNPITRETEKEAFKSLASSIIYQQLAYKAATSIWNKFIKKIGELTPENLMKMNEVELKECGLSRPKVNYLLNLAEKFTTGYEKIDFGKLTDEEVIDKLTQIKGIGKWTAEMFLIFSLERRNVCTYNDLGLREGLKKLYKIDKLDEKTFNTITEKYAPYKTIAAFYLWELSQKQAELKPDYTAENTDFGIGYIYTNIGWIKVKTSKEEILTLDFVQYPTFEIKPNELTIKVLNQLEEYFQKQRNNFTIPIKLEGTEFQKKVWQELLKIPYGETISYKELAKRIGNEKSSRAVGMANNKNKIGIIIPCHRVIGTSGKLTGYAGGIDKKQSLINLERGE